MPQFTISKKTFIRDVCNKTKTVLCWSGSLLSNVWVERLCSGKKMLNRYVQCVSLEIISQRFVNDFLMQKIIYSAKLDIMRQWIFSKTYETKILIIRSACTKKTLILQNPTVCPISISNSFLLGIGFLCSFFSIVK